MATITGKISNRLWCQKDELTTKKIQRTVFQRTKVNFPSKRHQQSVQERIKDALQLKALPFRLTYIDIFCIMCYFQ